LFFSFLRLGYQSVPKEIAYSHYSTWHSRVKSAKNLRFFVRFDGLYPYDSPGYVNGERGNGRKIQMKREQTERYDRQQRDGHKARGLGRLVFAANGRNQRYDETDLG
jgi:hypothetical protein